MTNNPLLKVKKLRIIFVRESCKVAVNTTMQTLGEKKPVYDQARVRKTKAIMQLVSYLKLELVLSAAEFCALIMDS